MMQLDDARRIAEMVVAWLRPACMAIDIAGSVRRGKSAVKDLEIVCCPKLTAQATLFGEGGPLVAAELNDALDYLKATDTLKTDPDLKRNGERYKRYIVADASVHQVTQIPLDLFITDQSGYGYILALRTGDAEFSKLLVTSRRSGGLLPSHLSAHDGRIWQGNTALATPDEAAFFALLGLPVPDASTRNTGTARRLLKGIVLEGEAWPAN